MITAWTIAVVVLAALILLTMIRLIKGPTVPDRVVAMDTVNTLVVASMILLSVIYQQFIFVDVAIVYALLSYVGVLFIAKYLGNEM
jgi:multicomponent Na+:H+ antiporter subunit F